MLLVQLIRKHTHDTTLRATVAIVVTVPRFLPSLLMADSV